MQRPEVICHVFATVDGRIDGAFMGDPAVGPGDCTRTSRSMSTSECRS